METYKNTNLYEEILDACLPDIRKLTHEYRIFQQDNAPPHAALLRRGYFEWKGINVLEWPPDLSSIKNILRIKHLMWSMKCTWFFQ